MKTPLFLKPKTWSLILATCFTCCQMRGGTLSDGALTLIHNRIEEPRSTFFIIKNQDDALNHGFPSGFYGPAQSKLFVDVGCVYSPTQPSGCETNPAALDRARGTVLRIIVDPLAPAEFCGFNFEDPEFYGVSRVGIGYSLSSVTGLVFDVCSPSGVSFLPTFADSPLWGWKTVEASSNWQQMTLPINPDPFRTNVSILVGFGFNDVHGGGTLLVDNVRLLPANASIRTQPSLPVSFETFGVIPTAAPPFPPDQLLRNLSSIYDVACSTHVLIARGTTNDLDSARHLADSIVYILDHPNSGLYLPSSADAGGIFSGVSAGSVALHNDQQFGAKAGEIRLSGFTCGVSPTGFCVVLDQGAAGDNSWAALALLASYREFRDIRYLDSARKITRWLNEFLRDDSGFGGYFVGYPGDGTPVPKPLLLGKSIEQNADVFSAFLQLSIIERSLGNIAAADKDEESAFHAGDFVINLYAPMGGRFYAGTVPKGTTPGDGINPDGPERGADVVNTAEFADLATFPLFSLINHPRYAPAANWSIVLTNAKQRFSKTVSSGGRAYSGFSLTPEPLSGPEGIALEFTAQLTAAFGFWDTLNGVDTFASDYTNYLGQIALAQKYAPFGDGIGLVSAILDNGESLPPLEQVLKNPFENNIPTRVGLNATAWAGMLDLGVIPLQPVMRLINITSSAAQLTVRWTSLIGGRYVLERSDSPDSTSMWTSVSLPQRGTGSVHTTTVASIGKNAQFFRVRQLD